MGLFYALLPENLPFLPQNKVLRRGLSFGSLVWLISYLGLLPKLGILESAIDHPMQRNILMIKAHFIWGISLALTYAALHPEDHKSLKSLEV